MHGKVPGKVQYPSHAALNNSNALNTQVNGLITKTAKVSMQYTGTCLNAAFLVHCDDDQLGQSGMIFDRVGVLRRYCSAIYKDSSLT